MKEQEMLNEIERLHRELAEVREERNNLYKMLCDMIPIDRTEITPEQFNQIIKNARSINDVLRDIIPVDLHEIVLKD